MHLTYENTNEEIIAVKRKPRHQPPHLHNAMEIVCVTKGTLELGVGQELYHMETGDIGVVFPDVIHHYQVFSSEVNEAVFINAPQMIFGRFENVLRNKAPQYPVVKSDAHDLGVSKFSLSRLFSKTFHSSFNQYVNEARLGYACQRIETTDDTLTEISMDSGFGSLRTFNRVFKEKYRLTPSEYRNKLQK